MNVHVKIHEGQIKGQHIGHYTGKVAGFRNMSVLPAPHPAKPCCTGILCVLQKQCNRLAGDISWQQIIWLCWTPFYDTLTSYWWNSKLYFDISFVFQFFWKWLNLLENGELLRIITLRKCWKHVVSILINLLFYSSFLKRNLFKNVIIKIIYVSLSPSIVPVCDMLSPQFDHYFNLYSTQGV